jgi:hypothetical protein
MNQEKLYQKELEKLGKEEINKLHNQEKNLSKENAERVLKAKKRADKKSEIIALYKEGGLSISDTIAYENNLLLERNRKNTSTIVTVIAVNIILIILGLFLSLGAMF